MLLHQRPHTSLPKSKKPFILLTSKTIFVSCNNHPEETTMDNVATSEQELREAVRYAAALVAGLTIDLATEDGNGFVVLRGSNGQIVPNGDVFPVAMEHLDAKPTKDITVVGSILKGIEEISGDETRMRVWSEFLIRAEITDGLDLIINAWFKYVVKGKPVKGPYERPQYTLLVLLHKKWRARQSLCGLASGTKYKMAA